jgi:hypothetical protein
MLKNIRIPVEIIRDSTSLGIKETLILEEQYYGLKTVDHINDTLNSKAASVLHAAALVTALVGGVSLIDQSSILFERSRYILSLFVFLPFVFVVIFSILAGKPRNYFTLGKPEWTIIRDDYLDVSEIECYHQILSDVIETRKNIHTENEKKAKLVKWASISLIVQSLLIISIICAELLGII